MSRIHAASFFTLFAAMLVLAGCSYTEKRVNLVYEPSSIPTKAPAATVALAPAQVVELPKLPGRVVLGSVAETNIPIVTSDSIAAWVNAAFVRELAIAGYQVREVPELTKETTRGLRLNLLALSANETTRVLRVSVATNARIAVEVWRDGRLVTTLTSAGQVTEEGVNPSAEFIGRVLQSCLQTALQPIIPDIVEELK